MIYLNFNATLARFKRFVLSITSDLSKDFNATLARFKLADRGIAEPFF